MAVQEAERVDELLDAGNSALKTGDKDTASARFRKAAELSPYDERVWKAMLGVVGNSDDEVVCLQNIVAINPANRKAKKRLAELQPAPAVVEAAPVETPPPPVVSPDEIQAAAEQKFDFYISPSGNDQWSGRLAEPNSGRTDGPFATLGRARDAVREQRAKNRDAHVRVGLRGGTYRLPQTVVFSMQDSAGGQGSTTYTAYPGETPIVSSGVPLKGWKKLEKDPESAAKVARGHLWTVDVPAELANVLSLYDGRK